MEIGGRDGSEDGVNEVDQTKLVTLIGFSLRSGNIILGRDRIFRSRHMLQFVWLSNDLSENSKDEVLDNFSHYPIICYQSSLVLSEWIQGNGCKVVGFKKSSLSSSIYSMLKQFRLNPPSEQE